MIRMLNVVVIASFLYSAHGQTEKKQQRGALQSIESTRGGRHWIDAKTAPPQSPEESIKAFKIEPGLTIRLFASEPMVIDPVAIAFDEQGRMFVVEYGDYPTGPDDKGAGPLSRVVMLEDTDGDHRADKRHLFADKLTFAHSLMPFKGGLLVGAQSEILFLKDTDGDHQADVRKTILKGFVAAHPQMQIGNPRWGFDNWIYFNYGTGSISYGEEVTASIPTKTPFKMPRSELKLNPLTLEFGPASGLGQFGNTIDNWGRRYFCTNRNPIMTSYFSWETWRRNPYAVISSAQYDVGASGGATKVYPLVAMKSNYLSHAGTHTSACGVTAYRGDLLGSKLENSVFVCEPIGHLVTRSIVTDNSMALNAKRAREKADFLASNDTWFRPASLATGPDGAMYLADMYRLWVEHPKFLPDDIAKRIDWRAGDDRGRVWRIVATGSKARSFHAPKSTKDRVALLDDTNGWRRQLGQRLIVEQQDVAAEEKLSALLEGSDNAHARVHALWTLDGLGKLTVARVDRGLRDRHPRVREHAARLAAKLLPSQPGLIQSLDKLKADPDPLVRFQIALALGTVDSPLATKILTELTLRDGTDSAFQKGLMTSIRHRSAAVLIGLLQHEGFRRDGKPGNIQLVKELATVTAVRGDADELADLFTRLGAASVRQPETGQWWQTSALIGLSTGLPRHNGKLGKTNLAKLLAAPPKALAEAVVPVRALLEQSTRVALDKKQSTADRIAAIELLSHQSFIAVSGTFDELLAGDQGVTIQLANLDAMRRNGNAAAADIVLSHWAHLGPRARASGLSLLLRRTDTTLKALQAMDSGKMAAALIDIDRRVLLLRHRDPAIQSLATKLLGGAVSDNRRAVAEEYRAALSMKATIESGSKVFDRVCSKCHKLDGKGHELGPDLTDVRNRSHEALLYDILDPNRKLEPRYTNYTVGTTSGQVFNGLMLSETSDTIVLGQAEGKQQIIPRNQIEVIEENAMSLMPEGVEKEVTVQQMADLLEFLKRQG